MQFVLVAQEKFQPFVIIPFFKLPELVPHKVQFFSGVRRHIAEKGAHACKFFFVSARHFIDERTFSVYDFVMRNGKNIIFGKSVHHRKGQFIMVVHTEKGIQRHVR